MKAFLSADEDGQKLVEKYQFDGKIPVTEKDRNSIINLALGHVINEIGHYYPQAGTKDKLAAAIVAAFPQMGLVRDGTTSHAYIYSSATANAYFDQHLKRMRKVALAPDQRKRKATVKVKDAKSSGKGKSLKKKSDVFEQQLGEDFVEQAKIKVNIRT